MPERQIALVLSFADDAALARWQESEWRAPFWTWLAVVEALEEMLPTGVRLEKKYFTVEPHPTSPYIKEPTLHDSRLHGPHRPSEIAVSQAAVARRIAGYFPEQHDS